ncbi:hypothetical protein FNV43_RR11960 [Rhamnella rubrinervis]|uniref:Uncharacterized protein n=1 Tax=Rhamnella rubrinervis TaxID=2594499 RepID=A0A8K0MIE1_9ROSA|nr:hypothetical protein FNV43_RR11960 [Rhamnella rubrinervis]
MGTKGRPRASSDRQNWQNIFNALVKMLRNQQTQLETLAKERKLLEDRFRMQHDHWVSDVRLLEDQISQMNGDLLVQNMSHAFEVAKLELVMGVKQREAFLNNTRLECADNELEDFKAWFDLMSNKCSDQKGGGRNDDKRKTRSSSDRKSVRNSKYEEHHPHILESEVERLMQENEKFASEKNSEISALLAEKQFVWNQYKIMEKDYTIKLKSKSSEVEEVKEKINTLLASLEQLQSSNTEKDERIARLASEVAKMNNESNKLKEETFRLSQELDSLRKSRSASEKPVLNGANNGSKVIVKKELSALQISDSRKEKGCRGSKRKGDDDISILETPKLFASKFRDLWSGYFFRDSMILLVDQGTDLNRHVEFCCLAPLCCKLPLWYLCNEGS